MKYCLGVMLVLAVFVVSPAIPSAMADGDALLGDGCYVIPTSSTLVKVLVGAEATDDVLVSQLTSGEIWVLKAFFSLTPTETDIPEHLELCLKTG